MRTFAIILSLLTSFVVSGESVSEKKTVNAVGIYDSRAIAVAYAGSVFCRNYIKGLNTRYNAAKAAGDEEAMLKAEAEAEKHQKQLHSQAFSTAPVDNILRHIKDRLPDIRKEAAVDIIISKWDTKSLAKYETAQKKDITMLLVELFKPDARRLNMVKEIQKAKPISIKEAENIKD
jgi:hypothetical protein